MNEYGTDAETFSSNMEFLFNGSSTNNGIRPRDLELPISLGEQGLEISDYDPKVEDDDMSDDGRADDELRHLIQGCGDYSNSKIEANFHARSKFEKPTKPSSNSGKPAKSSKGSLQQICDDIRESASVKTKSIAAASNKTTSPVMVPTEPERMPEVPDQRQKPKSSKGRKHRGKNVAIESILCINSRAAPARPSETVRSTTNQSAAPSAAPRTNGLRSLSGGRGRIISDNLRHNSSIIRPENIHGYNSSMDYKPVETCNLVLDEFPPL